MAFAESWLRRDGGRDPRGGEPRGMVTNLQEATRNTEAAAETTRVNEHFRKEIPL